VDHPFFMPPFPEGVSPQNSEVYEIALIIAEYDLYFLITLKRPASPTISVTIISTHAIS
jgi:hypothetical protein